MKTKHNFWLNAILNLEWEILLLKISELKQQIIRLLYRLNAIANEGRRGHS